MTYIFHYTGRIMIGLSGEFSVSERVLTVGFQQPNFVEFLQTARKLVTLCNLFLVLCLCLLLFLVLCLCL